MARMCAETHCERHGSGKVLTASCTQKGYAPKSGAQRQNNSVTILAIQPLCGTAESYNTIIGDRVATSALASAPILPYNHQVVLPHTVSQVQGTGRLHGCTCKSPQPQYGSITQLCQLARELQPDVSGAACGCLQRQGRVCLTQ